MDSEGLLLTVARCFLVSLGGDGFQLASSSEATQVLSSILRYLYHLLKMFLLPFASNFMCIFLVSYNICQPETCTFLEAVSFGNC